MKTTYGLFLYLLAGGLATLWLGGCESYNPNLNQATPSESIHVGVEGEAYPEVAENPFYRATERPVSSFSVDVDAGGYSNVRRIIRDGIQPPAAAIRSEEFINYFPYDYPEPTEKADIALNAEVSSCPWAAGHRLLRIGLKGRAWTEAPPSNLVMLVDVSGSMQAEDKLPLLQRALGLLVEQLRAEDRMALVTYAGTSELVLPSTPGSERDTILQAIQRLRAEDSTGGAQGIHTAYRIAEENFMAHGHNRVIVATDGDFNVGVSSPEELIELIEAKRALGISLTAIGTGSGNYQAGKMEQLANHGDGTYEYLDDLTQARKLFVHEFSQLFTVAQDVKVQVEFDPELIQAYRLIGYENRSLTQADFSEDSTDAGKIGAGQTITALYEVVPEAEASETDEPSCTVRLRYKRPSESRSRALKLKVFDEGQAFEEASEAHRWASGMASFALVLRDSDHKGTATLANVLSWLEQAHFYDPHGYRNAAIVLVQEAQALYD